MSSLATAKSTRDTLTLDEWQAFVDAHPLATPLHDRRWLELLREQYGFELVIPGYREGGNVSAATAFLETRGLWGGRKLLSLPFTDCFSPLSKDSEALSHLLNIIPEQVERRANRISMRIDERLSGYPYAEHWVRHRLDLDPSMQDLYPNLDSSIRRNIRRAKKSGLKFEQRTDLAAMEAFYGLHVITRRKIGIHVQPKGYFLRLYRLLISSGMGYVGLVTKLAEPISAGVFLRNRNGTVYKYGASHPETLEMRPNDFLFLNSIQLAARDGHVFDFGVTDRQDLGLRRFKRKWGSREEPVYDIALKGHPPSPAGKSRMVRLASGAIRRSPTLLCRAMGEMLYRYSA